MKGSARLLRGKGSTSVWELRAYAGRNAVTGKPRYVSRTAHGPAAVRDQKLADLIKEVGGGEHDGDDTTFGQHLDRWVKQNTILKDLSPTTVREYRRIVAKTIKPVLGDVPLRDIDGPTLTDFYTSLMSPPRNLSAASVRRVHSLIAASTKAAVKAGRIKGHDPAQRAEAPTVHVVQKPVPTPAQVQKLIKTAEKDDPDLAAFIALAASTGARRGELCGLRWGDVDMKAGTVTIERSYVVIAKEHIYKSTKSHGVRRIALGQFGVDLMRRHRRNMEDRASKNGAQITDATPVLSYNLVDPISPDTASHYVRTAAGLAGIDTHLHALRHFAATEMVGDGHDIRTVAGRLGHADASTTLRVYAHALPQGDLDAANALGATLTPKRKRKAS
jgi:integrase